MNKLGLSPQFEKEDCIYLSKRVFRGFPGGPVVGTPHESLILGQRTKSLQAGLVAKIKGGEVVTET